MRLETACVSRNPSPSTGAGDPSNLSSKNVQSGAALASATGLSLGSSSNGGLASNYNAIGVAGSSYTVTAKGITLTGISALDKTYDATTTATLNTKLRMRVASDYANGTVPFEFTKNYKFTVLNNENVWAKAMNRILSEKVPVDKATDEMIARIKAGAI